MTDSIITIWDGVAFRQVMWSEARELEKAGQCQICDKLISAHEFLTRDQMGGYKTREMKAARPKKAKKKVARKKGKT